MEPVANSVSPILWQSSDQTVTLIDVPRSISHAQGTRDQPCHDILVSTEAQQAPYPTNEPKSAAARAKIVNHDADAELHEQYAILLQQALTEVTASHFGSWCLPRPFVVESSKKSQKRTIDCVEESGNSDKAHELPSELLPANQDLTICNNLSYKEFEQEYLYGSAPDERSLPYLSSISLISPTSTDTFRLPPHSSFFLSPCSASKTFRNYIHMESEVPPHPPKKFPFILLDPPWPNRSIKRTHKTADSSYSVAANLPAVQKLILGLDLDMFLAPDCLVGIWITNKPAVRELVLGEGGLFDTWGIDCVEEWIWLKVTAKGDPLTPLRSAWRKPYEVLVLGRKRAGYEASTTSRDVKRRVLMSVPDLHSRKPCLKALVAPLVGEGELFRGLEVFARHLVSGWWSWGDEAIKFNWEGYWRSSEAQKAS